MYLDGQHRGLGNRLSSKRKKDSGLESKFRAKSQLTVLFYKEIVYLLDVLLAVYLSDCPYLCLCDLQSWNARKIAKFVTVKNCVSN